MEMEVKTEVTMRDNVMEEEGGEPGKNEEVEQMKGETTSEKLEKSKEEDIQRMEREENMERNYVEVGMYVTIAMR